MRVLCSCPHVPASRRNGSVSLLRKHQQPLLLQGGWLLSLCYEKGGFVANDKLVSWWWLISVLFDQSLAEVSLLSSWSAFPKWLVLAMLQYNTRCFFFLNTTKLVCSWHSLFLLWFKRNVACCLEKNGCEAMTWCRREDEADGRKSGRLYFDGGRCVKLGRDLAWRKTKFLGGGAESEGRVRMQNFTKGRKPCFSWLLGMQLCSKGGINEHFQTPEWN